MQCNGVDFRRRLGALIKFTTSRTDPDYYGYQYLRFQFTMTKIIINECRTLNAFYHLLCSSQLSIVAEEVGFKIDEI